MLATAGLSTGAHYRRCAGSGSMLDSKAVTRTGARLPSPILNGCRRASRKTPPTPAGSRSRRGVTGRTRRARTKSSRRRSAPSFAEISSTSGPALFVYLVTIRSRIEQLDIRRWRPIPSARPSTVDEPDPPRALPSPRRFGFVFHVMEKVRDRPRRPGAVRSSHAAFETSRRVATPGSPCQTS